MVQSSAAETELAALLRKAKLKGFKRQVKYVPGRKFSADFAFPEQKLIVEVDGGIYTRRAHGSVGGIISDMKRTNFAAINGWRVMRYRPDEISKEPDRVIQEITQALNFIEPESEN